MILRYGSHPSMDVVRYTRCIGSFLEKYGAGIRAADLPPTHTGHRAGSRYRLAGDDRLMRAEVSVSSPKSRPLTITKMVDPVGGAWLLNACAAATTIRSHRRKGGNRDSICPYERRIGRSPKIRVKLPQAQCIHRGTVRPSLVFRCEEIIRRAGGRQCRSVEIGRQQTVTYSISRTWGSEK
jgi:hypothetical protein